MHPIELAHEPSFQLGRVSVLPAQRELVRDDGTREVLEQRVMQVLIALFKSKGAVLTRDELMSRCWTGRVVGEDALNRVMSRLRKAAEGIGGNSFRVETITKVGYRLVEEAASEPADASSASSDSAGPAAPRRMILAAGLAVGVVALAGAGALIYRREGAAAEAETQALIAQAWTAWTQGTDEGNSQAIGLYRRLLDAAPQSADGWGLLAVAYGDRAHNWTRPSEREPVRIRARSAARRALELDPKSAYGRVAMAYARPVRGNWLLMEQEFRRAAADQPGKSLATYSVGFLLGLVGRFADAAPFFERIRNIAPTVNQYRFQIEALWGAGRLDEAERLLEEAVSIYAANPSIWRTHFDLLLFGGRARAAIAMVQNADARHSGMTQQQADDLVRFAIAVAAPASPEAMDVVDLETNLGRGDADQTRFAIQNLSAVGRVDEAFAFADAYFFSRGFVIPDGLPKAGDPVRATLDERQPSFLFHPSTRAMRGDPRFNQLAEELSLERYWREAKAAPDYRRLEAAT